MLRVEKIKRSNEKKMPLMVLITSPYNLRYLTNFTGTTGLAVITLEKLFSLLIFVIQSKAAAQAQGFEIVKIADRFLKKLRLFAKKKRSMFWLSKKVTSAFLIIRSWRRLLKNLHWLLFQV